MGWRDEVCVRINRFGTLLSLSTEGGRDVSIEYDSDGRVYRVGHSSYVEYDDRSGQVSKIRSCDDHVKILIV